MKKRTITMLLVCVLMAACLAGCGCKHEWADASCTAPKTCNLCGEIEGEALPHEWIEANYQSPKTCSVCSGTEGEALTASFEAHGLTVLPIEEGVAHDYVTTCYTNNSKKTTGALYLENYTRFDGDDTHEALEGYEWVTLTVKVRFDDENANKHGMTVTYGIDDYYNVDGFDASIIDLTDETKSFTVNYNGEDYKDCLVIHDGVRFSKWVKKECWSTCNYAVRIPCGYDGIVINFIDSGISRSEDQYIYDVADENTLFFRLA